MNIILLSKLLCDEFVKLNIEESLFDISNHTQLNGLLLTIQKIQNKLIEEQNIEDLDLVSRLMAEQIFKEKNDSNHSTINFIIHFISYIPFNYYCCIGNHNKALSYVSYSFSDNFNDEQSKEFNLNRPSDFINNYYVANNESLGELFNWIGNFYFICRRISAYENIANEMLDLFYLVVKNRINVISFGWAIGSIACWANSINHKQTPEIVLYIQNLVKSDVCNGDTTIDLLLSLSTELAKYTKEPAHYWANIALRYYEKYCKNHQKLHFLFNVISRDFENLDRNSLKEILLEITDINNSHDIDSGYSSIIMQKDRLFEMIKPAILALAATGNINEVLQILSTWYEVEEQNLIDEEDVFFIDPTYKDYYRLSSLEYSFHCKRDVTQIITNVTRGFSEFNQVSHSVRGVSGFEVIPKNKDRFGVPKQELSDDFELLLKEFYNVKGIKRSIKELKKNMSSIVIPSDHYPMQYIFQKYLGKCYPQLVSLEAPQKDRSIVKVCIWSGSSSLTEEVEYKALNSIFNRENVQVDYFSSVKANKAKFLDCYQDNSYDVIWIMSHGIYDHWKPLGAEIVIGNDETISLDELKSIFVPQFKRRLLFLNVCDGAAHTSFDGLPKLGFAPALTNRNQCSISHLWPVNPWVASLFGVVFAENILKTKDFFQAYSNTLGILSLSNDKIIDYLFNISNLDPDFIDRIKNQRINYSLLAHSGSAAFYQ
ncbi:CHAT domain-containing protein [Psychromonas algicola]|uniref:CHAT domain-containing protein n=1 Tax=Psychromonas algicola TaxID=2555642 RepID=UPI001067F0AD|nr:CHAT domain-containing protein [Psychromonas sp. RZ5]TEW51219.1 CHAT domain-containing protein [Psychromonas sp. RZ5]